MNTLSMGILSIISQFAVGEDIEGRLDLYNLTVVQVHRRAAETPSFCPLKWTSEKPMCIRRRCCIGQLTVQRHLVAVLVC